MDLIAHDIPVPVCQAGDLLRLHQTGFALPQCADCVACAQQIAHPVAEGFPDDGLGNEVSGTGLIRMLQRFDVIQPRHHHDGDLRTVYHLAYASTDGKAIHLGHPDVEQYQVRSLLFVGLQGGLPVARLDDLESGLLQVLPGQQALGGLIIHDEDQRVPCCE